MTYEEAKTVLEAAGYHVHHSKGETMVYVRTSFTEKPLTMGMVDGCVSKRTVNCLLKAKKWAGG